MTHARTAIRNQVAAMVTGLRTTGTRVFKSRLYSKNQDDLPSVSVFITHETSQPKTQRGGARLIGRVGVLRIVGHAMQSDDIETTLDTVAAEIEVALAAPILIGAREVFASLTGTEIETDAAESQVGAVTLSYDVNYATTENEPETIL